MSGRKIFSIIAFIGTLCIAFALMFRAIFESNATVVNVLMLVGEIIAFSITAISAFYFVKEQKHIAWKIIYAIAVTAMVALLIVVNL